MRLKYLSKDKGKPVGREDSGRQKSMKVWTGQSKDEAMKIAHTARHDEGRGRNIMTTYRD